MISRDRGEVELACDDCSTETFGPYPADDFAAMMEAAYAEGWRNFKRNGEWHNACPDCVGEWIDGMKQERLF